MVCAAGAPVEAGGGIMEDEGNGTEEGRQGSERVDGGARTGVGRVWVEIDKSLK